MIVLAGGPRILYNIYCDIVLGIWEVPCFEHKIGFIYLVECYYVIWNNI